MEIIYFFIIKVCVDFLVGSVIRFKFRYFVFSEIVIFGRVCRYEFLKRFINMKYGERYFNKL